MSDYIIRVREDDALPDGLTFVRLIEIEDVPIGAGTATVRVYSVLVTDGRPVAPGAEPKRGRRHG